jgi:hypothetical protein
VFWSVKSGLNLYNAALLPSQTALWFMNKFDENKTKEKREFSLFHSVVFNVDTKKILRNLMVRRRLAEHEFLGIFDLTSLSI